MALYWKVSTQFQNAEVEACVWFFSNTWATQDLQIKSEINSNHLDIRIYIVFFWTLHWKYFLKEER